MKILITSFDPFGGESVNPAYEAVKLLPDTIAGAEIIKLQVPTRFTLSGTVLEAAVNEYRPDAVICVGQAGGRSAITPERVAINLADASIPDNAGDQPVDEPIRKDGAPAYFTSLPVKAMVQKMRAAGIPAALSYTAGSFVCNSLMYTLLYLIDRQYPAMRGGFIHVPYAMEQAVGKPLGTPSMDLHQIARGILQPDFAQELVDALWLKYSEWVWTISANTADYFAGYNQFQNLTVGGKTRSGVLYRVCRFV
ncbi:pyroglutamyl-peptidase I [Gemmiger sp.]|uniref:pyroglutamyl-peptidase I n=1 Tax=Gemmiger sp. TaxID=2049027 RepID=UPI003AB7DED8